MLVENEPVPLDRRAWMECRSLVRAGYAVSVICPQGETRDREPHVKLDGVDIYRYPPRMSRGGASGYLVEYASALLHMRRLARRLSASAPFDVVHLSNPPDVLFLAVLSLRRRGSRIVFDHHDLVPELYSTRFGRRRGVLHRLARLCERASVRIADVVVSPNESYRRIAVERDRKTIEDTFVVRNAPEDTGRFSPGPPRIALKRGKRFLIAYLGVIGPQDGVDHALRAFALLAERRNDWHTIVAGAGDALDASKQLAANLGLLDRVEFPGFIGDDEIVRLLRTADVCLSPEPKDDLNDLSTLVKVAEYMAFGKPVVAYDLPESRFTAQGGALYASSNEPASLASCIERLLDDGTLRARVGEEGRRRVVGELAWELQEPQLLAAYARALAKSSR